jgi:hypothetical protein
VNFIGALLAKLPLSKAAFTSPPLPPQPQVQPQPHVSHRTDEDDDDEEKNLPWTTLDVLITALTAIRTEIDFYTQTVNEYALPLDDAPPNITTQEYIQLFRDASADNVPFIVGMVVLWGTERVRLFSSPLFSPPSSPLLSPPLSLPSRFTLPPSPPLHSPLLPSFPFPHPINQSNIPDSLNPLHGGEQCYLDAWTYASSQLKNDPVQDHGHGQQTNITNATLALTEKFIPNWTSDPFREFVNTLASVTDAWWVASGDAKEEHRAVCEGFWARVLELEAKFWPGV